MSNAILPKINSFNKELFLINKRRLLIVSEGFEERSVSFLSSCEKCYFDRVIVCRYFPPKESKYTKLMELVSEKCNIAEIQEFLFNRYDPFEFENQLRIEFERVHFFEEVVVDISVMSKYMIMQIVCSLEKYIGNLTVIYSEPLSYAPSEEEFQNEVKNKVQRAATVLPSSGVHDIIRTPLLTSIVMQKSPALLVAFLSFNEQLIRALLSEFNPMRLYLINGAPPYLKWRENAMSEIHNNIIKEYSKDNPVDKKGTLKRKSSTLNYIDTFNLLAKIYREHCVENRIVLSPTGSKMQALGCSLIKLCCPDIHIEYPTPESYYISGYSSSEIREIHQVTFNNIFKLIKQVSNDYKLNQ